MDTQRLRAYLRLHLAEGVGAVTFGKLAEAFGGVEPALAAGAVQWRRVGGVGPKKIDAILAITDELIDQELDAVWFQDSAVPEYRPEFAQTVAAVPPQRYAVIVGINDDADAAR